MAAVGPLFYGMVTNIICRTKLSDTNYDQIFLDLCYRLLLNINVTLTFVTDLYYSTYVTVLLLQTLVKYPCYTDICYRLILQYTCYRTYVTDFCFCHMLQDTYDNHLFFTIKIAFLIYDLHLKNVRSHF